MEPLLPDYVRLNGRWHASRPAWICGDATMTWGDFDAAVNRVANGLVALGVKPGEAVGVVMDNGLAMATVLWGILASGAIMAPLNTSVSDAALAAMLQDAEVRAVFASAAHVERLAGCALPVVPGGLIAAGAARSGWQRFEAWRDAQSALSPGVAIDPGSPCTIVYSSGTTARPKGIVHSHRARRDWALDLAPALRYAGGAITLCSIGLYSNIVWAGMLPTVIGAGTLVVMPRFDGAEAMRLIARHRITNTAMVPVQYRRMLDADPHGDVSSVRGMMSAGSPLWDSLRADLVNRFGRTVIELYGLTEGLITVLAPEEVLDRPGSVGKPLPGTDLRIVDETGRDLPPGTAGEIVGCSRFVMSGYHNRPDATAEALMRDAEGRVWLRTGDIGRLDDEGYLSIVGRKKDLILSGGQNIYPSDIEAVAIDHPAVADVAVIGIPDAAWGETPLALIVLKPGWNVEPGELKAWINDRVGRQQRVSAVELRAELPRNPNGKLLKADLRAPYWG